MPVIRTACLACALAAVAGGAPSSAQNRQSAELGAFLARTAAYVQIFVDDFSNVVAEEEYTQTFRRSAPRRRVLKSDFLLVRYPGEDDKLLLVFRDVREVDRKPVRDQQERLTRLFLEPHQDALKRAGEITRASDKYSVDRGRLMNPLQAISYLQGPYQGNFDWALGRPDPRVAPDARQLRFSQVVEPTMRPFAIQGRAWVSERSGRVFKTELRTGPGVSARLTTTTFGFDPGLRIDVPVAMRDDVPLSDSDEFTGRATYGEFRRFQVRVEETIDVPPNPR